MPQMSVMSKEILKGKSAMAAILLHMEGSYCTSEFVCNQAHQARV